MIKWQARKLRPVPRGFYGQVPAGVPPGAHKDPLYIPEIKVFEAGFDAIIDIGDIRNRFLILALGEVWMANALEWAHELAAFWRSKVASDIGWIRTFGFKRSTV